MICYRDADGADAARLAALSTQAFLETFCHLYRPDDLAAFVETLSEPRWVEQLNDRAFRIRLAADDGIACGFAKVGPPSLPFKQSGASAELRQFYVLAPWQGQGVADVLMEWVIATAREAAADTLYLSVFVDNARARRFYTRYGFERVGSCAFMVGTHEDEDDVMRLAL